MNRFINYARLHFFISSARGDGGKLLENVRTFEGRPVELKLVQCGEEDVSGEYSIPGSLDTLKEVLDRA